MKKLILILMTVLLTACTSFKPYSKEKGDFKIRSLENYKQDDNVEFTKFLDETFIDLAQTFDLATYLLFFENPEKFNIKKPQEIYSEIIYGSKEAEKEYQNLLDKLYQFDYSSLSKLQQSYFRNLEFALTQKIKLEKFSKYQELFEPTAGVQTILYYFISLEINSEDKLNDYMSLFKEYPNYVNQALDFSQKQFEDGLFMNKYKAEDALTEVEGILENSKNDFILDFEKKIALLDITNKEEKINEFKNILSINQKSYEKIKDFLTEVIKSGKLSEDGYYSYASGKEYFQLLVTDNLGTTSSVEELIKLLNDSLIATFKELQLLYNQENLSGYQDATYDYSPIEIIEISKKAYSDKFPKIDEFNYILEDIEEKGRENRAHYIPRKLGSEFGGKIRIPEEFNPDFHNFTTMIHEAIPGHLYQFNYYENLNRHPLMRFFTYRGYSEGWAMYIERYGLEYFKELDQNILKFNLLLVKIDVIISSIIALEVNNGADFEEISNKYSDLINSREMMEFIYKRAISDPLDDLAYGVGWILFDSAYEYAYDNLKTDQDYVNFHQVLLDYGNRPFEYIYLDVDQYVKTSK